MKLNKAKVMPAYLARTGEGAVAARIGPEKELMRLVMTCLLWERNFYSYGNQTAAAIAALIPKVSPEFAAAVAYHARTDMHLRHVPLFVVREMVRHPEHKKLVGKLLPDVIQRPDEIAEFLAIYYKDNKDQPLAKQAKLGLARAFGKFNEYQLAKFAKEGADIRVRDVMFLVHPKPEGAKGRYTKAERRVKQSRVLSESEELFRKLANDELETPETWETQLSVKGADKKAVWEGLMLQKKLGAQAFIMNLRNMTSVGVDRELIKRYAEAVSTERVLPYQFLASARANPALEDVLEPMMLKCLAGSPKILGSTKVLLDVSGSMDALLSSKGGTKRVDAACGIAILLREQCENVEFYTFSDKVVQVAPRQGFALRDAILSSQHHNGTYLGQAVGAMTHCDRLIVLTDEQSSDPVGKPDADKAYMINVASEKNGVGYGKWHHIDGWSEKVLDYIYAFEQDEAV